MASGKRKREPTQPPVIDLDLQDDPDVMHVEATLTTPKAGGSGPGRGRQAWRRDVESAKSRYSSSSGPISRLIDGDSDESIEFKMALKDSARDIRLTLCISEQNDYLGSATFLAWADDDVPDFVTAALDSLGEKGCITLNQALEALLKAIAGINKLPGAVVSNPLASRVLDVRKRSSILEEEGYGTDVTEDEGADDELFGLAPSQNTPSQDKIKNLMRRDFKGLVEAGYRPGWYHIAAGHVITATVPISSLQIPVRNLDAWDPCLVNPDRACHLVLLALYGTAYTSSFDSAARFPPRFAVGLSPRAKPSRAAIDSALRSASGVTYTPGEFELFALSKPLDALMAERFLPVYDFRQSHPKVGWAGAENATQQKNSTQSSRIDESACQTADAAEDALQGYKLPADPLKKGQNAHNVPLAAFAYLIRRFVLCPRFCVICHSPVEHVAVRPFVCSDPLCSWQYQDLSLGPDIEYEIRCNTSAVDLLIQFAFVQAAAGLMKGFPTLSLQVNTAGQNSWTADMTFSNLLAPNSQSNSCDLDTIDDRARGLALCSIINEIPPVLELKAWLEGQGLIDAEIATSRAHRKLGDIRSGTIPPVVFKVLRWIITSNTSYLREMDEAELVPNVARKWKQYRFLQASPQREARYQEHIASLRTDFPALSTYPDLWAFHGSPIPNWHSILRESLHYAKTTHGRAYGNGVYFAQEAETSMSSYATYYGGVKWRNAHRPIVKACAICRLINVPEHFVSFTPHYVVSHVEWIQTRFLLVEQDLPDDPTGASEEEMAAKQAARKALGELTPASELPLIQQDPGRIPRLARLPLAIPDYVTSLEHNRSRVAQDLTDEYSIEDADLLREPEHLEVDDDGDFIMSQPKATKAATALGKLSPPYQPFAPGKLEHLRVLPAPRSATAAATMQLQREVASMMREQEKSTPTELGWYYDPDVLGSGNLYHWILEMINFDPDIPLAKDMKSKGVPGILFEILFPPSFPFAPPFIRVVWPRFLSFAAGGGGHVTAGGSICMDLLTMTGWNSIYRVPAIMLQIKTAISTDPRAARLDRTRHDQAYTVHEAIDGFRRAAYAHGWRVPPDLDRLALGQL